MILSPVQPAALPHTSIPMSTRGKSSTLVSKFRLVVLIILLVIFASKAAICLKNGQCVELGTYAYLGVVST